MTMCRNYQTDSMDSADLEDNPLCHKTNVTLRLLSPELDPDAISASLSIQPTRAYVRGAQYLAKRTRSLLTHPTGHWSISTETMLDSTCVEKHARKLASILEPCIRELGLLKQDSSIDMAIVVWWEARYGHGDYTITSETMARLAAISNRIVFHVINGELPPPNDKMSDETDPLANP